MHRGQFTYRYTHSVIELVTYICAIFSLRSSTYDRTDVARLISMEIDELAMFAEACYGGGHR